MSYRSLIITIIIFILIIVIGIIGYIVIEDYSLIDSFYMTIITIGTVGFREIKPLSDAGKIFTSLLIIASLLSMGAIVTSITKYFLEGYLKMFFNEKKTIKMIKQLHQHVIICGFGRNGSEATKELISNNEKVVVIEKYLPENSKIISEFVFYLEGDATKEENLIKANIQQAKALITALPNDADNLYVILSAKELNPNITIITRASDHHAIKKLYKAGAKNVILPDKIGGIRMAKLVHQPNVIDFIEQIIQLNGSTRLAEIICTNNYYHEKTIRELDIRNAISVNIIGLRRKDGTYIVNPSPDEQLHNGDALFVLGTNEQINTLTKLIKA